MTRGHLHGAATHGDLLAVQDALNGGEKVDSVDLGRSTALHWAARKGHVGVAAVLVSKNASLDSKTKLGKTPIDLATEYSQVELVDFLTRAMELKRGRRRQTKASTTPHRSQTSTGQGSEDTPVNTPQKQTVRTPHSAPRSTPRSKRVLSAADKAEAQERMIAWARELANEHIEAATAAKAAEEARRQREEDANVDTKAAAQKAEIQRLLSVLKDAREGISTPSSPEKDAQPEVPDTPTQPAVSPPKVPTLSAVAMDTSGGNLTPKKDAAAPGGGVSLGVLDKVTHAAKVLHDLGQRSASASPSAHGPAPASSPAKSSPSKAQAADAALFEARARKKDELQDRKKREQAVERRRKMAEEKKTKQLQKAQEESRQKQERAVAERQARLEDRRKREKSSRSTSLKRRAAATPTTPQIQAVSLNDKLASTDASPSTPSGIPAPKISPSRSPPRTNRVTMATPSHEPQSGDADGETPETAGEMGSLEDEYLRMMRGMASPSSQSPLVTEDGTSPRMLRNASSESGMNSSGLGGGLLSANTMVDGHNVITATHKDIVDLLQCAPQTFTVVMNEPGLEETDEKNRTMEPKLTSTLKTFDYIVARKDENDSLGVALLSEDVDGWVQVHMVVPQGPFFSAGVRANDVILKINGTSVLGLTHPEVVAALKVAGLQMTVTVAALKDVMRARVPPSDTSEQQLERIDSTAYTIQRGPNGGGLGIALCSEKDSLGVRLRNVTQNGPFGAAGVPSGHIIVGIDGYSMLNASHADVVEALRNAGETFTVAIASEEAVTETASRRRSSQKSREHKMSSGGLHPTRHDVKRIPGKGLGVALVTKRSRMGVRISQLNPDGPLAKAGLKEGDVIVQVHGVSCLTKSHLEVVAVFRDAPDEFAVVAIDSAAFDKVTPRLTPTGPANGKSDDAVDGGGDGTSIGYDAMRSRKAGGSRASDSTPTPKFLTSGGEEDDMRLGPSLEDPRLVSLENTEGYKALKKAQQEAFKLSDAAQAYDKRFSTGAGRPASAASNGRSSNATAREEELVDIATLHNIWHAEFSPETSPTKRSAPKVVPGRIKTFI